MGIPTGHPIDVSRWELWALWYARGRLDERDDGRGYDRAYSFANECGNQCMAFNEGDQAAVPSIQDAWRCFEQARALDDLDT